jgi:hypothetical protein
MIEIMELLQNLSHDFQIVIRYILSLKKTHLDELKETWIEGKEVIQTLHISTRTLQSLRDEGTLKFSRINGKFYYKVSDLENLLESNYSHDKTSGHGTE